MNIALLDSAVPFISAYQFSLDELFVHQSMSKGTDTDWVYCTLLVGGKVVAQKFWQLTHPDGNPDIGNGYYLLSQVFPPVRLGSNTQWIFSFQIINHGEIGTGQQAASAFQVAAKFGAALEVISDVAYPPASAAVAAINEAIAELGSVLGWIIAHTGCDGVAVNGAFTGTGDSIQKLIMSQDGRAYSGKDHYIQNVPIALCNTSDYEVTWSATLIK